MTCRYGISCKICPFLVVQIQPRKYVLRIFPQTHLFLGACTLPPFAQREWGWGQKIVREGVLFHHPCDSAIFIRCIPKYRITGKKAHPGDNVVTFQNIITGCAVVGGVLSNASPGDKTPCTRAPQLGGVVTRVCANGITGR